MRNYIFILFSFIYMVSDAQELWSLQRVLKNISQYHPLAKVAGLQVDMSRAELLTAKGQFDPKLELEQVIIYNI